MHTTDNTTSTAMADLDLDKLEALARSYCADCVTIEMSMNPAAVLDLIALARRAAQPVALSHDVLAIPAAILEISTEARQSDEYKRGHRDARHAAADLVLARADELKALATPSPQVAEGAELPPLPEPGKPAWDSEYGYTAADMRTYAIAASRRAPQVAEGAEDAEIAEWEELTDLFTVIAAKHGINDIQVNGGTADELFPRALAEFIVAASRRTAGGEAALRLLNHIEDVVSDADWEKIDPALWNAVTTSLATPAPASAGQAAPVPLVDKLMALRDEAKAERQSETNPNRRYICEGMSLAFGAAAILAAQPAEGAGQAGQVADQLDSLLTIFEQGGITKATATAQIYRIMGTTERAAALAEAEGLK